MSIQKKKTNCRYLFQSVSNMIFPLLPYQIFWRIFPHKKVQQEEYCQTSNATTSPTRCDFFHSIKTKRAGMWSAWVAIVLPRDDGGWLVCWPLINTGSESVPRYCRYGICRITLSTLIWAHHQPLHVLRIHYGSRGSNLSGLP